MITGCRLGLGSRLLFCDSGCTLRSMAMDRGCLIRAFLWAFDTRTVMQSTILSIFLHFVARPWYTSVPSFCTWKLQCLGSLKAYCIGPSSLPLVYKNCFRQSLVLNMQFVMLNTNMWLFGLEIKWQRRAICSCLSISYPGPSRKIRNVDKVEGQY